MLMGIKHPTAIISMLLLRGTEMLGEIYAVPSHQIWHINAAATSMLARWCCGCIWEWCTPAVMAALFDGRRAGRRFRHMRHERPCTSAFIDISNEPPAFARLYAIARDNSMVYDEMMMDIFDFRHFKHIMRALSEIKLPHSFYTISASPQSHSP